MLTDWFHRLGTSSFDNRPDVLASIVAGARHTHLVSPAGCVGWDTVGRRTGAIILEKMNILKEVVLLIVFLAKRFIAQKVSVNPKEKVGFQIPYIVC